MPKTQRPTFDRVVALRPGSDAPDVPARPAEGHSRGPCGSDEDLSDAAVRALAPFVARGLGFDVRAAILARRVRLVALHTVDGSPLPRDWAIPLTAAEAVIVCAPLGPPFVGVCALVVQAADLPRPATDEGARERVARALAEIVLAEIRGEKHQA